VKAMLEAADLVVKGQHKEVVQDEEAARYEGWCKEPAVQVNWHNHVDTIYNLIRGCNPAPGAWTTVQGKKVQLFDSRKHRFRTFGGVKGKSGEITEIGGESIRVTAQGGQIEVFKVKPEGGKKIAAVDFVKEAGLGLGTVLGN
jgi:methionyl-tRNA formyltransferase